MVTLFRRISGTARQAEVNHRVLRFGVDISGTGASLLPTLHPEARKWGEDQSDDG